MAKTSKAKPIEQDGVLIISVNRKAFHNYEIEEKYEAGLVLLGTEVKGLRTARANMTDAHVEIDKNEAYIVNMHISPYSHADYDNHKPLRRRKLLLHKREINRLRGKIDQRGYTAVALRLYFKKGLAKLEIGLGKGRKTTDKRRLIQDRDERRFADRYEKERRR